MCEDCENDDNFWCSWSEGLSEGNTIACANHSGTLACADKGSKAINVSMNGSNGLNACKYRTITGVNSIYENGYFNLISTANWDTFETLDIFRIYNITNSRQLFTLYVIWDGSNYKLNGYLSTADGGTDTINGPTIQTGTWYRVGISYARNTQNGGSLYVEGTEYSADDNETTYDYAITRVYIGSTNFGSIGASETVVYQWDCLELDDDTMPGACPE
jgi:hypothetical protein